MKLNDTTCNDVFQHLCENLDENLDSPKCRMIKQHLDGCPDCMTYLDGLKKTVALYRLYPVPHRSKKSATRLASLFKAGA